MSGKYLWILLAVLLVVPVAAEAQVSPDTRLLQRPEWDGAVFTGLYLDGQFRYQKWDEMKSWMIGPTFAMSFAEMPQLETGARVFVLNSNPDGASDETGFSDIDLWGKLQFLDDPLLLSAGLLITLPTGAEKVLHPKASGEFNVELFGAGRYYATDMLALIGHIGLRINSDMDVKVGGVKGEIDGETQFLLGAGVICEATPELDVLGELNFATEAYKDYDSDIELTGGVQYNFSPDICGRGGIGIGLDDGAPDFELILGASAFF
ncbi:MAG: hypothetical protein P9M08_09790 [Candidatus Erginobacter occultus]|nr:hypothetical protein [Candidatus Erginobacter occultus]